MHVECGRYTPKILAPMLGLGELDVGRRKLLAGTLPFASLGPVNVLESVDTKLASLHVPEFQELPD